MNIEVQYHVIEYQRLNIADSHVYMTCIFLLVIYQCDYILYSYKKFQLFKTYTQLFYCVNFMMSW